ncbi:BatD family protein [Glaciecola sp. 1036]|uniref:BatD family protein n=1 Tax=Alteromonadaceae TaxID=72275 RepID=UPI003CFD087F
MKHILSIIIIFCTLNAFAKTENLIASVDQNPVLVDESFTLTITANGSPDSQTIDFSALEQNFRVSAPSVSQSTQIINGNRSSSVSWRLTLFPRATGSFEIPSFSLDGKTTQPITLNVVESSQAGDQPREFYITTEVSENKIYLQQQLVYTVKIFLAGEIQSGSLSEPVLDGAIIEKLGEDKEYQELINGVRYRVIERNFAIIPQSSGEYKVQSPLFEARVLSGGRQGFAYFNRTKNISRVGEDQQLTVAPIPPGYQYTWLPSELVQINEEWQGDPDNIKAGEPITRTITLTALGLIEEQLPDFGGTYHPSFKTYPEQPQKTTVQRNNKLIAQSVQSTAIIAEQNGQFVVPEIRIPWFNVNTGKTEFAVVPAKSVTVTGNQIVLNNSADNAQPAPSAGENPAEITNQEANSSPRVVAPLFDWLHILLMVCVVLLSVCLFVVWSRGKTSEPVHQTNSSINTSETAAWHSVVNCIKQNKTNLLPQKLCHWLSVLTSKHFYSATDALKFINNAQLLRDYDSLLTARYKTAEHEVKSEHLESSAFLTELENQRQKWLNKQSAPLDNIYQQ